MNTNSCPWCMGWSRVACPDMPPLALLSWHSFLPGERAPQHHMRLPGAAASQAQIVLMSLAFCKSLPFFNFWEKQKKKININNSRLFKLQEVLICASNKWLARCQGFSFRLFLTYFYYFCINLGEKLYNESQCIA